MEEMMNDDDDEDVLQNEWKSISTDYECFEEKA